MPTIVELPNNTEVEFPDGMSDEAIARAIRGSGLAPAAGAPSAADAAKRTPEATLGEALPMEAKVALNVALPAAAGPLQAAPVTRFLPQRRVEAPAWMDKPL